MIFSTPRIAWAIYPETTHSVLYHVPKAGKICKLSIHSKAYFLNLPTEIRLQIYYYYLLSLGLPDRFFTHLTMLGYWCGESGIVTRYDERGYDLGRRISKPLVSLLLLNRQIRIEVEEVLYSSFVFCIHPSHSSADSLREFYSNKGARPAPWLRNIQINMSMNPYFWHSPPSSVFEKWRAALKWLSTELPQLRTVGLAIDYSPQGANERTRKEMIDLILSFARIFKSVENVSLRFADVKYDQYGHIAPVSSPLCAELLEEEKLLLRLRDNDKLIWHHVAMHFNDPCSELYSVTSLQARYKRLKVRQQQAEMEAECLKRLKEEN